MAAPDREPTDHQRQGRLGTYLIEAEGNERSEAVFLKGHGFSRAAKTGALIPPCMGVTPDGTNAKSQAWTVQPAAQSTCAAKTTYAIR